MVRKCLMLTLDAQASKITSSILTARLPSHLHVASIMNELTDEEKQTFGKVNISTMKQKVKMSAQSSSYFTEDKVDQLIDVYLTTLKSPYDLIVKTVERSKDRFQRDYSKLEANFEHTKFYTDEGLKERKEKLKLRVFMNQLYGQSEAKTKNDATTTIPFQEQILRMLQVHNSKVERIRSNFKEKFDSRQAAKDDIGGITTMNDEDFSEDVLDENRQSQNVADLAVKKTTKKKPKVMKKPLHKGVEVEIKVKGQDGQVTSYQDEVDNNNEESKKAVKKKKTVKSKIQSEETLEMLMNALKP